jgi:CheY-like chemotaxis protein
MGGTIGVESTPGQGSCFWFTLPRPTDAVEPTATAVDATGTGFRILIVDDAPLGRTLLAASLERWGNECVAVATGAEALERLTSARLDEQPFDVVLLDRRMPEMDGVELGRRIQADPALRGPALVLMTPVGLYQETQRLRGEGFATILIKPITRERRLREAVLAAVAQRDSERQAEFTATATASVAPGCRVLLLEDNPVSAKVISRMLLKLGCGVVRAGTAEEAAQVSAGEVFDLMLADVHLIEGERGRPLSAIRQREAASGRPRLPIIVVAPDWHSLEQLSLPHDVKDDVLIQPIRREALRLMLERWAPAPVVTQ